MQSISKSSLIWYCHIAFFTLLFSAFAASYASAATKIVFVGNSYTEFHFDDRGRKVIMNDLPALVQNMLTDKSISITSTINYGKTLKATLTSNQMAHILATKPDAVILQEGRYAPGTALAKIRNDFSAYLKTFANQGMQIIYLKRLANSLTQFEQNVFASEEKLCRKTKNCHIVDLLQTPLELSLQNYVGADGVHPRPILTWLNARAIAQILDLPLNPYHANVLQQLKLWNHNQVKYGHERDQSEYLNPDVLAKLVDQHIAAAYHWIQKGTVRVGYQSSADKQSANMTLKYLVAAKNYLAKKLLGHLMPTTALITDNRVQLDHLIRSYLGYHFHKSPSRPSLIAISSGDTTLYLSPRAYESDSKYTFDQKTYARLVTHETMHLFEYQLNAQFENYPKFLIEGMPIYFSKQYLHLDEFKKPVHDGVMQNQIPTLDSIQNDTFLSYVWGWTIVKFIDETRGRAVLVHLAQKADKKNFFDLLNTSPANFETVWRDWLIESTKH